MTSLRWPIGLLLAASVRLAAADIKIDGRLDEPEWADAQVFTDFRVTQPYTLANPRHPTEVRLLGTPEGIAIGFRVTHPSTTPRQKEQTPRDIDNNGDRVNIYIDLDADAQVAYNVTVALAGSLQDATITHENVYSTDWDGDETYAVRDEGEEWFVEILLPWTIASMKNTGTPKRTIGVMFDRVVGDTQERSALEGRSFSRPRFLSEFPRVEIAQYTRSLFHIFPYATAASDWVHDELDWKFGADLLWKPSGRLQVAAAINPDFGQVEADELVVNFDAIEVLFTDRRPFFTENQALFDVRLIKDDRLLYTRRIGGARDDDPQRAAEIDGAVKVNGSVGRLDYGVLAAAERDYTDDIGRAFAAPRLRFTSGNWTIGYLGTWVDHPFLDRTAMVHSTDFIWRPNASLQLQGYALGSFIDTGASEKDGDGAVLVTSYNPTPEWQQELALTHYSDTLDFNDLGFQGRASMNRATYAVARRFREFAPEDSRAAVTWRVKPEVFYNDSGDDIGPYLGIFREAQQRSGALLNSSFELVGRGVDDLISRGHGNAKMEPRLYWMGHSYQTPRLGKWRLFGFGAVYQEGNDDYAYKLEGKVEHYTREDFNMALRAEMRWSRDWLIWREDNLLASFHRTRSILAYDLNWFPALDHELRVKLQWLAIDAWDATPFRIAPSGDLIESTDLVEDFRVNNFGLQVRYRWTFAPQSDLYVVYGRGGIEFEEGPSRSGPAELLRSAFGLRDSDQLLVKVRYRF